MEVDAKWRERKFVIETSPDCGMTSLGGGGNKGRVAWSLGLSEGPTLPLPPDWSEL